MFTLETIKNRIKELHETNQIIHVKLSMKSPRIDVDDYPVVITDVYTHIFQIEENYTGKPRRHFIQYNDVLINHFQIKEL